MPRNAKGAAAGTVRPAHSTNASVAATSTPPTWRAQLIAARFALPIELAATVALLAWGGTHG
ncbi:hypothetical protein ACFOON_17145 [Novosphingobium piscinae]|uniref:Uncharacterized protein n=1 Tax=Novosphingobium piscinae TaxID=1507448 RepID=A0A7X1FYV9_9SPHN|nr:hypothetical protein [Novosphingobium piscinae]MBC2669518.1 hypothetical protein [Novosphingobium piscinae]